MWISEFADKKSANNEGRLYWQKTGRGGIWVEKPWILMKCTFQIRWLFRYIKNCREVLISKRSRFPFHLFSSAHHYKIVVVVVVNVVVSDDDDDVVVVVVVMDHCWRRCDQGGDSCGRRRRLREGNDHADVVVVVVAVNRDNDYQMISNDQISRIAKREEAANYRNRMFCAFS